MMSGEARKLCVVCSSSSSEGDDGEEGVDGLSLTNHQQFSQFLGELELCCLGDNVDSDKQQFTAFNFLTSLLMNSKSLFACSECLSLISEAMEGRVQLEEVENQILRLQIQLLTKMQALQQCTKLYFKEMSKVYEKVRNADVSSWEESPQEARKRKGKCEVLLFREKIMDVVTYLGMFQDDLDKKFVSSLRSRSRQRTESYPDPLSTETSNLDNNDNLQDSILNLSAQPEVEQEEDYFDDQDYDDDPNWEVDAVNIKVDTEIFDLKSASESCGKSANDGDDYSAIADNNDADGRGSEEGSDEDYSPSKKNRKQTGKTTDDKQEKMKVKRKRKKKIKKTPADLDSEMNSKLLQIDFKTMGPLKGHFIRRMLTRPIVPAKNPSGEEQSASSSTSLPDLRQVYTWDYDPLTDKLTLSGYRVKMEEDETLKQLTMSCASCDYQYCYDFTQIKSVSSSIMIVEYNVFNHVVGCHHHGYQCQQCEHEANSLEGFKLHMLRHGMATKFTCDECGMGFDRMYNLKRHTITHMVGEERKIKAKHYNEKRPPNERKAKNSGPGKTFGGTLSTSSKSRNPAETTKDRKLLQCSVCGKAGFSEPKSLKVHEESHLDRKERSLLVCPHCGRQILRYSYYSHKFSCPGLRDVLPRHDCTLCGKSYQGMKYYRRHMLRKHNEFNLQKPFRCDDCGVRFKMPEDLRNHRLNLHQTDRKQLECRKGCGKKFVLKCNMERHEENCPGAGADATAESSGH